MTDRQGTPIWFEHSSDDPAEAKTFYEAVAGWTVGDPLGPDFGDYRLASAADGDQIAGFMASMKEMAGMPGWALYFAVDDVDAAAERIKALGGQLHFGPKDIPGIGRFATVADPQNVPFHIMRGEGEGSKAFKISEPGSGESVGHAVWIELSTPDPDGAFAFYGDLFGWTKAGAMPMGDMGEYAFISRGGDDRPGAIMSSTATGAPARWNWYINVPDIDAAVAAAERNGGALKQGPDPIPGGDFAANVGDNQGFQIGLVGPRKQGA